MRRQLYFCAAFVTLTGCAQREGLWEQASGGQSVRVHGMRARVALVDTPAERVIFASPESASEVAFSASGIGRGLAASRVSSDGERLVLLTRGDVPRETADDQAPGLSVIDPRNAQATSYELADPLSGLELDPKDEYALIYPGGEDTSFLQNPNELTLVKLTEPPSATNPVPASLRSFGGRPEGFTFTPELKLPGGSRRLLVVRTDRDVALIDLNAPEKPEITVKLTTGAVAPRPVGIAVTDGEPDDENDARLGVRLEGEPSVLLLDLLPTPAEDAETSPHSFLPAPNIVDIGGPAADITFARTDGGLRLLALVPSKQALTLVEPATGVTTDIALGGAFERISLVTDIVGPTDSGSDVALLWSTSSPAIAFVALGTTIGKPYKSVEVRALDWPIGEVLDVPAPNAHLKVLSYSYGGGYVVLNLLSRTTTPLLTSSYDPRAVVSPDGERLWVYSSGDRSLALVGLSNLHPENLLLRHSISSAFDVERADGGRALLALDVFSSGAMTLLDARDPKIAGATEYLGVLLGDYEQGGEP